MNFKLIFMKISKIQTFFTNYVFSKSFKKISKFWQFYKNSDNFTKILTILQKFWKFFAEN